MAYTESTMLELGTIAPDFTLPEPATGRMVSLSDLPAGKATVVMFLCNHCPYVLYINDAIVSVVENYASQGVQFIGINSNDADNYPEDAPEKMGPHAAEVGYTFPYLYDESQEVARAYDAACTPDFYVFDGDRRLVYRGQLDESRPKRNAVPATGADLRAALDAVLQQKAVAELQRPSGGCNIKWKN